MTNSAKLLYQGHASLRIDTAEGKTIYVDPFMGKGYDVPADLILETHAHHDHTCTDLIKKKNGDCRIITWAESIKDGKHQTFDLGFVKVEAVEAGYNKNHNSKDCVGFILSFSNGTTLYISGDTSTTPQMKELAARKLDYAFFCCDGVYNMDIPEAMECARMVGAKHSVPYHMIAGKDFDLSRAESFDVPGKLIVKPGDVLELVGGVEGDNRDLIGFWDRVLTLTDEDKAAASEIGADDWKEMAPSEKLFNAVSSLGGKKKVLDYGCGNGWGGIVAAKSGCPDVTAVDVSKGPAETTAFYAKCFVLDDKLKAMAVGTDWLGTVSDKTYDGLICSNVLDVVPTETSDEIIREIARITTDDASVIIGMNFYMTPEECAERGMILSDGCKLYEDGVLRLVFKSDEEWKQIFSKYFTVERLEHFAWPGESKERRRLFYLMKRG